jgi:uracil DNA glycosylase
MKGFLSSKEFEKIQDTLKGKKTIPDKKYAFNAFKLCPLAEVHTLIISVADEHNDDGLAFSSRQDNPSIQSKRFWKELQKFENIKTPTYDLSYLADQGFLLLNLDLVKTDDQHTMESIRLWKPFFKYLVEKIKIIQASGGDSAYHLTVVLVGNQAHKYFDDFNSDHNDVYRVNHPLASVEDWDSKGIFERITNITQFIHDKKINWDNI